MKKKYIKLHPSSIGLVGHWKLWAGLTSTATVFDYSFKGNDGTLFADPTPAFPGFSFDGVGDHIAANVALVSAYPFTFSAWINQPVLDTGAIFSITDLSDNDLYTYMGTTNGGLFQAVLRENGQTEKTTTSDSAVITADTWHHVAIVFTNATTRTLYVDGSVVASTGTDSITFDTNIDLWALGAYVTSGGVISPMAGKIDDVMIFNVAKSAAEIKSIHEVTRWRYGV